MSGFKQDAIIFDPNQLTSSDNIVTVPLTRIIKKELVIEKLNDVIDYIKSVSYTHLTLPTIALLCRSRWSPYH